MHNKCQKKLWTLTIFSLTFVISDKRKKTGQSLFFIGKNALFSSKFSVFNGLLDLKESCCWFHSNCQISLWTLKNCSLMFVTPDETRKVSPKSFLHRKDYIFLLSYQLPGNCQNTLLTLIICSLTFFMFDKTRKKRPKTFLHWKDCLYSKLCVFNNLLGPKEMLLYVPD